MLALVCCLSCHVSPLVLNLKRMEAVLLTEQRPRRPRPLVCSLQSSQPLAHWRRGGFRRVTWQRKEGPARTPPFPERLCFFGTTHFVVCVPLPLHENSYIRCLVPCCVCVGPLILKTMTLGSLGDRASELIDDLVPKSEAGTQSRMHFEVPGLFHQRPGPPLVSGTRRADPASISDFAT